MHRPEAPDPELRCDLLFTGNRLPDRERRVEQYFLEVAATLPARRFILGGSGWGDKPLPANVRWIGHVSTGAHNRLNGSVDDATARRIGSAARARGLRDRSYAGRAAQVDTVLRRLARRPLAPAAERAP